MYCNIYFIMQTLCSIIVLEIANQRPLNAYEEIVAGNADVSYSETDPGAIQFEYKLC